MWRVWKPLTHSVTSTSRPRRRSSWGYKPRTTRALPFCTPAKAHETKLQELPEKRADEEFARCGGVADLLTPDDVQRLKEPDPGTGASIEGRRRSAIPVLLLCVASLARRVWRSVHGPKSVAPCAEAGARSTSVGQAPRGPPDLRAYGLYSKPYVCG